jgi:acyl-CoA reductase-like NAD-dependent aldehyde dehydrogenase
MSAVSFTHLVAGRLQETSGDPEPALLDTALAAAVAAAPAAEELSIERRAELLEVLADALSADSAAFADAAIEEIGTPRAQAQALQVGAGIGVLRAFAQLVRAHRFIEERPGLRGGIVRVLKHPIGPVLAIVPWNVPLYLGMAKLGAAVAAGCPILLKPAPENAGMMRRLAGHLAALAGAHGLAPGHLQMVVGGREIGAALVADPRCPKISFTGSVAGGRAVAQAAAARLARVTLELGGKSAAILLDDFAPEASEAELFLAMLQNNGQICGAQSRLLVPAGRAAELTDWLAALFDGLTVGDPHALETEIGPLATSAQAARVQSLVAAGEAGGAKPLSHAHHIAQTGTAVRFVTPRLYAAEPENVLAREEVFGPVTVVMPYANEDEAVALANASDFGLSGSVWSTDTVRAGVVAKRLRTGTVGINSRKILDFGAPFGGWRASGLGRELGPEGIDACTETSSILLPL